MLMVIEFHWVFSDGCVETPIYTPMVDNVEEAQ